MQDLGCGHRQALGLVILSFALAGCGESASDPLLVVVHDSASIRIVETVSAAWSDQRRWTVSVVPETFIGVVAGDGPSQFVRISGAIRLSDGRIAVLDEAAHELRFFASDGTHVRTVGGEGNGPGELQFPTQMYALPGDSLLVNDFRRMSVFSSDGDFVRTHSGLLSRPVGRYSDGSVLYLGMAPDDAFEAGQVRESLVFVRRWLDPPRADSLRQVPGAEVYRAEVENGLSVYLAPFARTRMVALYGNSIYTGDGTAFEFHVVDDNGQLIEIVRRPENPRTVTPTLISAHEAQLLESARYDQQRQVLNRSFREWTYPEEYPAFDRLVADHEGNLWLRGYVLDPDSVQIWSVFDPERVWLGEVSVPPRTEVMDIGADYLLGVTTDDLGVEYVALHRIRK